jgi:hypothetical protein
VIRFLRKGTYLVTVTVEYNPDANRVKKQHSIQRDDAVIETYCGWGGGIGDSSLVLLMTMNQTLCVFNTSASITELGSGMFTILGCSRGVSFVSRKRVLIGL